MEDDVAERTAPTRHEPGRMAVPFVGVPRSVIYDPALSMVAKALLMEASARLGRVNVADVARRPSEDTDDVLDAVGDLLRLGYATLELDVLVLTPIAGWSA